MLSEEQIDYLFQIRDSKLPIPPGTVQVMLKALCWTPEEIEHGIDFLKRPDAKEKSGSAVVAAPAPGVIESEPEKGTPIKIKQNPFPIGSPFATALKQKQEKKHKKLVIAGGVFGFVVFVVGVILYVQFGI